MKLIWKIEDAEVRKLKQFIREQDNPFVEKRIARNIHRDGIELDKNNILRTLIMCLLTSQQRSGPDSPVGVFLKRQPYAFSMENLLQTNDQKEFVTNKLVENNLRRYVNRITDFFITNFEWLQADNWLTMDSQISRLSDPAFKEIEREVANILSEKLKGIGPKQSRNFLQSLGLTRFEIPIDSRITNWLNDFGFPVTLSSAALQDIGYYQFVSDGIQALCTRAGIYPCVIDAAIFSSFDDGGWTEENLIY